MMKKMMILILVLFAIPFVVADKCYNQCVVSNGCAGAITLNDGSCICTPPCSSGGVPEFSTIGITAIIALAAGGAIGFNIGKKKK